MTLESGELLVYNVTAEDLNVTFQCLTQLANEVYASPLTRYLPNVEIKFFASEASDFKKICAPFCFCFD